MIFCNAPWYEFHIYWDGSFGICCQESHKLYSSKESQYNVATMPIMEWFNSAPARQFRTDILGQNKISPCTRCYLDEHHAGNSRRINSNQKSVIFTKQAFQQSFNQSPGYEHFLHSSQSQGHTNTVPIDIHVDLGNYCNLACKMCYAGASSTIASQHVKWGIEQDRVYLGQDWTRNVEVWEKFKNQLLELSGLNNIHLMGGETLLTNRFEDLIDFMIEHNRTDMCFSFVTNGTIYRPDLIEKLKKFRRVGIEISIESTDQRNDYIRQGTDTSKVLDNIEKYSKLCNDQSVTLTLRPTFSLLSAGSMHLLLKYALDNQLIVKGNACNNPSFLSSKNLPDTVKQQYLKHYKNLLSQLPDCQVDLEYNASDPNNYETIIKNHLIMYIDMLESPSPLDQQDQLKELVAHCKKWDAVYKFDARKMYPELSEVWNTHGY